MNTSKTPKYLAAFGLGYSLTTLKDRIYSDMSRPNKKALLKQSIEQIKTYQECYLLLFGGTLEIPCEYVSDAQMVEFFSSLFEITENKIAGQSDKNLYVYYCAGGLIYLSDSSSIIFDEKKFKVIFYELLSEVGSNITWNEMSLITSQLYCGELRSKREAKKQILDFMFYTEGSNGNESTVEDADPIFQSLFA